MAAAGSHSACFGETHQGAIQDSVQLPMAGENFKTYSQLGWYLGRTHVHSQVAQIVLETYAQLKQVLPNRSYVYGETGWSQGGSFPPHKTHQNGLSVDFMVPVLDRQGKPAQLPLSASNQFGYAIDFDRQGQWTDWQVDFDALAVHLKSLHQTALTHGIAIKRVFLAPDLQPLLLATEHGPYLQQHINFNDRQAWVRHDDHYHVDFAIDCEPMGSLKHP